MQPSCPPPYWSSKNPTNFPFNYPIQLPSNYPSAPTIQLSCHSLYHLAIQIQIRLKFYPILSAYLPFKLTHLYKRNIIHRRWPLILALDVYTHPYNFQTTEIVTNQFYGIQAYKLIPIEFKGPITWHTAGANNSYFECITNIPLPIELFCTVLLATFGL